MDSDGAPRHVLDRADVIAARLEQRAGADGRGLRDAEDASAHVFRGQSRAKTFMRQQIASQIVEFDDRRGAQQFSEK